MYLKDNRVRGSWVKAVLYQVPGLCSRMRPRPKMPSSTVGDPLKLPLIVDQCSPGAGSGVSLHALFPRFCIPKKNKPHSTPYYQLPPHTGRACIPSQSALRGYHALIEKVIQTSAGELQRCPFYRGVVALSSLTSYLRSHLIIEILLRSPHSFPLPSRTLPNSTPSPGKLDLRLQKGSNGAIARQQIKLRFHYV
jgi:hypothetical protein